MDWTATIDLLSELTFLLVVLGLSLGYATWKGRQALINVIMGLYVALLISLEFPYYDFILNGLETQQGMAVMKLAFFALATVLSSILFTRIMPDEFRENRFESFGKKLLLALSATVLVMIFSFHVLPVTDFLTPGTLIQALFAPAQYFFWWLLLPLVILYTN
jgi:hydrogenase-4 membrane subunit HyfE